MKAPQVFWLALSLFFVILICITAGCSERSPQQKTVLKIVPAGSLLQPFDDVEKAFEAQHPDIDVQIEGHGSIQAIRQVTDLHRSIDVVAVADASLIPDLMYRKDTITGTNFTGNYTSFARNAMVIAYTGKSRYADEITPGNWYTILSRPDVRVGFSNPVLDAAGYRTFMVAILAGHYYHNATIFPAIIGNQFDPPLVVNTSGSQQVITLPEIMRPTGQKLVIRDGSIYVLSLLESGGIDYAFEYRSVAEGHNLNFVSLPAEIDLSSPGYSEDYRKVSVVLGFQRFNSIGQERMGQPIVYAITVPNTAPHPELAHEFSDMVVSMAQTGGTGWPAAL